MKKSVRALWLVLFLVLTLAACWVSYAAGYRHGKADSSADWLNYQSGWRAGFQAGTKSRPSP
jgi:hypothetical protein